MFKIPRQSYTAEFKREAVKMVEAQQRPAEVAKQLGASEQTSKLCIRQATLFSIFNWTF